MRRKAEHALVETETTTPTGQTYRSITPALRGTIHTKA